MQIIHYSRHDCGYFDLAIVAAPPTDGTAKGFERKCVNVPTEIDNGTSQFSIILL